MARVTSSSSQPRPRTFGRWPSWSRCPHQGPHRNRQNRCSRHYNELLPDFFNRIGQKRRFDPGPATSGQPRRTDILRAARHVTNGANSGFSCGHAPRRTRSHANVKTQIAPQTATTRITRRVCWPTATTCICCSGDSASLNIGPPSCPASHGDWN